MKDIKALRNDISIKLAALWKMLPFTASVLAHARILAVDDDIVAGVSPRSELVIGAGWNRLTDTQKVAILAHEALHIAFRDHVRKGDRDHIIWNIVADAHNNEILRGEFDLPEDAVFMELLAEMLKVPVEHLKHLSKEALYELLEKKAPKLTIVVDLLPFHLEGQEVRGSGEGEGKGQSGQGQKGKGKGQRQKGQEKEGQSGGEGEGAQVVQEGDPSLYGGEASEEEWKRVVAQAWAAQRMAGTSPAALERAVGDVLKPKVPWAAVLRAALQDGLGKTVVETYQRDSRRFSGLPGTRRWTTPTVWVGVDTSGSIEEEELTQFISEVDGIARASGAEVWVIPWDAKAYEPQRWEGARRLKIKGGGGTEVWPTLELLKRRMDHGDIAVIISDFYISDKDYDDTTQLARAVAARASVAIAATVAENPPAKWGWRVVRIK